jgi:hypothetical protein
MTDAVTGLGCKRDPSGAPYADWRSVVSASEAQASRAPDLSEYDAPPYDQQELGTCVPHWWDWCEYVLDSIGGAAHPVRTSIAWGWFQGQMRDGSRQGFVNRGIAPWNLIVGYRDGGWLPDDAFPYDEILTAYRAKQPLPHPKIQAYHRAFTARGSQALAIAGNGTARPDALAQATSAHTPAGISILVDDAFQRAGPDDVIAICDTSKVIGGHRLGVLALDYSRRVVLARNWWVGRQIVMLSFDFVSNDSWCFDAHAVTRIAEAA